VEGEVTIGEVQRVIGVFDSGVGGLSVLREIRLQMPAERVIYLADQAHVPYGSRSLKEVRGFARGITEYLLSQGAGVIVVACNTASAAALHYLRQTFSQVPFVGMEPAVKPAVEQTETGKVGVLATPATFQGELYASLLERFAHDVTLLQSTCPGLVGEIEAGRLFGERARAILRWALEPMLAQGIDTVVLGCTHYPFVIPLIKEIVGPQVRVIDPAPAVARQVGRVLARVGRPVPNEAETIEVASARPAVRYLTTGDPAMLEVLLSSLIGEHAPVEQLRWERGKLI
jgi:glutamate racemase